MRINDFPPQGWAECIDRPYFWILAGLVRLSNLTGSRPLTSRGGILSPWLTRTPASGGSPAPGGPPSQPVETAMRDPPPALRPDEKPSPAELAKLAREVLSDMAKDDPSLAQAMRERGIPPDWEREGR